MRVCQRSNQISILMPSKRALFNYENLRAKVIDSQALMYDLMLGMLGKLAKAVLFDELETCSACDPSDPAIKAHLIMFVE